MKNVSKPKICAIDLSGETQSTLDTLGLEVYNGTLGSKMDVPNKNRNDQQRTLLDFDLPSNFHEYDILIIDLTNSVSKFFEPVPDRKSSSSTRFYFECSYPSTVFDSRPPSSSILFSRIKSSCN